MSDWRAPLAEAWHRTFGKVKCHMVGCPVCGHTDWPMASWVNPQLEVPLHLESTLPRRTFNLRDPADFEWLRDYFSGYLARP